MIINANAKPLLNDGNSWEGVQVLSQVDHPILPNGLWGISKQKFQSAPKKHPNTSQVDKPCKPLNDYKVIREFSAGIPVHSIAVELYTVSNIDLLAVKSKVSLIPVFMLN